jgi:hypothetical protein
MAIALVYPFTIALTVFPVALLHFAAVLFTTTTGTIGISGFFGAQDNKQAIGICDRLHCRTLLDD